MLSELSRQRKDRWLTWITKTPLPKPLLIDHGFDVTRIQNIRTRNAQETLWLFWEALNAGTSATVVTESEQLCDEAFNKLEAAAINGGSQGLLIRYR